MKVLVTMLADFPGYAVSRDGRVWSFKHNKGNGKKCIQLKTKTDPYGYTLIGLWKDGKQHWIKVHKIVFVTFKGIIPEGHEINHEDGNKANCAETNLSAVTHAENMKHAWRTGLMSVHYGNKHRTGKSIYA